MVTGRLPEAGSSVGPRAKQAEALSTLTKSIIAFTRHGHGEDTIDEYGGWSEDDRRRWLEREAREQRKNAS
jgi:hypothetical protein